MNPPKKDDRNRTRLSGMAAAARVVGALHSDDASEPGDNGSSASSGAPAGGATEPGATGTDPPRIAGYTLHHLLGRGGGGAVYLATRDGFDRRLALKLLNQRLGEGPAAQRAWRELDVLSQLHLAATPRVIDYGLHDGRLFIAAEYVDGLPLDRHCDTGGAGSAPVDDGAPSPPRVAQSRRGDPTSALPQAPPPLRWTLDLRARVELLARVADAVHALHEHGVIHRDIKPSNVIIDTHGDPVIIDLGLAALIADDVQASLTAEGVPIGSPAFMAPEQARGERSLISTRSDVYGLGASAYLVLTGHTPHDLGTPTLRVGLLGSPSGGPSLRDGSDAGGTDGPPPDYASGAAAPAGAPNDLEHRLFSSRAPDPVSLSRCVADSLPLHAAIHRVATQPPRDPRSLAPTLPRPLAAVLLKAVAPKPQDRYPSAAALAADLRRWLRAEPVTAQPPTLWTRATRWIARHPITATTAACLTMLACAAGASVTTWRLSRQPYAFILDEHEERWATLISCFGNPLKTWTGSFTHSVPLADVVSAPASFLGEALAVVCSPFEEDAQWGGRQVAVYRLTNPDNPVWMTPGPELIKIPPPIVRSDDSWQGLPGPLCNIFDDSPGEEIVVIHTNQYSQRAIRVYRLDGKVLFEAWHDGAVDSAVWFPEERLLVFAGDNHEHNTPEWSHVDLTGGSPLVVLAIRPDFGGRHAWIHGPAATEDDRSIVVWYRYLEPVSSWTQFEIEMRAPHGKPAPGAMPRVNLGHERGTVAFALTPDGQLSADCLESDSYRRAERPIVPTLFRLVDFPPPGW